MGRKKLVVNDPVYDDNESIESKLTKLFSPEHIICNFTESKYEEYKNALMHRNIQLVLHDRALMQTVAAFFSNDLNTSVTSDKTFMHRNTLNYRLEKLKRYTGLDLKRFDHAVLFKNLVVVYRKLFSKIDSPVAIHRKRKPKEDDLL